MVCQEISWAQNRQTYQNMHFATVLHVGPRDWEHDAG